jgi:hypothetical protein
VHGPFRESLPLAGFAEPLLNQDANFVGGGNTQSALAVWRELGLERVLGECQCGPPFDFAARQQMDVREIQPSEIEPARRLLEASG